MSKENRFSCHELGDAGQPEVDDEHSDPPACGKAVSGAMSLAKNGDESRLLHKMTALTTFEGRGELLRGIGLAHVLRSHGQMLSSSADTTDAHSLSREVRRIRAFVSHNWVTPRRWKYLSMTWHFNFNKALVAMLVVAALLALAQLVKWLPALDDQSFGDYPGGVACRLFVMPVFGVVLLYYWDLRLRCGNDGPAVFLDKACITQSDKEVQRQCIVKLAAFIESSEEMVVLYSDVYLRKLWTIYEVAAFVSLKEWDRMRVVPVFQTTVLAVGVALGYIYKVLLMVLTMYTDYALFVYVLAAIAVWVYGVPLRLWSRECRAMPVRLAQFNVKECICAVEADRAAVYSNIAILLKGTGAVPVGASQEEALRAFNKIVKDTLPYAFESSLGWTNFAWKHYFVLGFALDGGFVLDLLASAAHGRPPLQSAAMVLYFSLWVLVVWPVGALGLEVFAASLQRLTGWRERLWLGLAPFLGMVLPLSALDFMVMRPLMAEPTVGFVIGLAVALSLGTPAVFFITSGPLLSRRCPRCLACFRRFCWQRPEPTARRSMRASLNFQVMQEAPTGAFKASPPVSEAEQSTSLEPEQEAPTPPPRQPPATLLSPSASSPRGRVLASL